VFRESLTRETSLPARERGPRAGSRRGRGDAVRDRCRIRKRMRDVLLTTADHRGLEPHRTRHSPVGSATTPTHRTRYDRMTDAQIPTTESIQLTSAPAPYVLAIDIGSGSTRGCLYDAYARPIKKRLIKADHAFTEAADGTAEVDADQIVDEVAEVLEGVLEGIDPGLVRAVVMDTFASSLVCVDAD